MGVRTIGLAAGFLGVGLLFACSSHEHRDASQSTAQAIQGGTTDSTDRFAVGVCAGGPGACYAICSGALIAPNLVVTARHCVDHISSGTNVVKCAVDSFTSQISNAFYITTNQSMLTGGSSGWYQVASITRTPQASVCGNDLALLTLGSNVPASEALPVTPAVQYPITDHNLYSSTMTAIGYGITAPGATDMGLRRIRQNIQIGCIPGDLQIPCPTSPTFDVKEFVTDDGTCSGDSGSSAYEQTNFTAGKHVTLGVLSRGGEDGGQCIGGIYTRLDSWASLVIATVKQAATLGGYAVPAWTLPAPVTSADAGVKPKDAGTPPSLKQDGVACTLDRQCASAHCILAGSAKVCRAACDPAASACGDGFVCSEISGANYCVPGDAPPSDAPPDPPTTTTTTSCRLAPPANGASSGVFVLPLLMLARFGRRRRPR